MSANTRTTRGQGCRRWSPGIAALAVALGSGAFAQVVSVPAAHLNHAEGSIAYAPQGDQEWHDVEPRRLLKRGDRLWTDRGSRAEVQAGGHALRMNDQTQLILENVGETATQLSLTQGSIAATVTRVNPGDSFEIGTPNLAFRARQPGDYRIDVDTKKGVTRVVVLSGSAVVYGEKGEALEVRNGQRLTFRDRNLTRLLQPAFAATDDFDRWAGARKRGEPTVRMPIVAAAPEKPIPNTITRGKDIVISGSAASLKPPAPHAKAAAPVAPAIAQPAALAQPAPKVMPSSPPTLRVA
ncbi:FecR domain-containing protein, partial [Ramlibacter alkalitolerans]